MTTAAGCAATSSTVLDRPSVVPSPPAACPVFVMQPLSEATAFQSGNVGGNVVGIMRTLEERILEVVREQCPGGEIVRTGPATPIPAIPGYAAALGGARLTADELRAANVALQHGATYLLVPTVLVWTQMRTDDPIGAFILPHNRISVALRLMRLQVPAVAGRVTFSNRSRLTLNQSAERLLNDDFRMAVRQLLWGRRG